MKIKFYHGLKLCAVLAVLLLVAAGCSSSGGGTTDDGGGGGGTVAVRAVVLVSSTGTVAVNGTATVTATVTDDGEPVSDVPVTFQVAAAYGSLNPTSALTGADGTATATFTASATPGTATITATAGGVSDTVSIAISQTSTVDVDAIALVAAQNSINPEEETTLTATAYNASGIGITGAVLFFTLDDPTLGSVTETATTGADGTATATFTARTNPGTVNVTAISGGISASRAITILDQTTPANIVLSASATSVSVTNTLSIMATVTDGTGTPVDNGTTVSFEVTNPTFGSITASGVTNAGVASATFTASSNPGTATIAATSGAAEDTIDITVSPVEAASIEFVSVSQNPIAIRGTGVNEFSIVTFAVKDVNGNQAQDVDVLFTMSGPGGLEYIEADDATPTVQTVGTTNGEAEITLYSGYEPGPVTINASITTAGGATITATTPVISIGGGVPTDRWLSISSDNWILAGLVYEGIETEITAWLADRYGNFNVLDGHSVSFQSEPGIALFSTNATADAYGTATVQVRTQSFPWDVVPEDWECDLVYSLTGGNHTPDPGGGGAIVPGIVDFSGGTGAVLPGHPRDGVAGVLVHTKGEEHFFDGSGGQSLDGQYNFGETFTDTADDPFRDYDDDGLWDDGTTSTPAPSTRQAQTRLKSMWMWQTIMFGMESTAYGTRTK